MQLIKVSSSIAVVLLVTVFFAGLATIHVEAAATAPESNSQVEYSTWPSSGTTIPNQGLGGSAYNGKAVDNDYIVLPSGATAFALNNATDNVTVPHGKAIDNLKTFTFEFVFRLDKDTDNDTIIYAKGYSCTIVINSQWSGVLEIQRYDQSYTKMRHYRWYDCGFTVGGWYDIQLTWNCTGFTNVPVLKINNVTLTAVDENDPNNVPTAWADDSGENITLWNWHGVNTYGTVPLFRFYNVVLSSSELADNYNADKWRWESSGAAAGAPAVTAQNANSLDLFVNGTDSALWWKHWNGTTWSASASLGGILTSDPAATSPASGVVDVYVRGSNGALYEKITTNGGSSWSGWTSLGGQIPAGTVPAACSWGSGRLDLFVQGTDGALWHKWYTGTSWSGWQSLGGKLTSSAAAATAPGSSRIDVFVRGTDGAIWQRTTTTKGSSWSGWTSRGGQIPVNTVPAACSWSSGRVDLFANGTDGQLWWKYTTNGGSSWTGWQGLSEPLGKSLTSSPAAAAPASGIIDVFVRGGDNGLWERTYNGSWSGWTSIPM